MKGEVKTFLVGSEGSPLKKVEAMNAHDAVRIYFRDEKQNAHPTTCYAMQLDRVTAVEASWQNEIKLKPLVMQAG